MKKILALILVLSLTFCLFGCDMIDKILGTPEEEKSEEALKYEQALALIGEKKYEEAYAILVELGDYADAKEQLLHFRYVPVTGSVIQYYGTQSYNGTKYYFSIELEDNGLPGFISSTDVNGEVYSTVAMAYDANDNLVFEITTEADGGQTLQEWEYDQWGNVIKEVMTDGDYSTLSEWVYDENGNLLSSTYKNGTQHFTYEYRYDQYNQMTYSSTTNHESGDHFAYIYKNEYDQKGQIVRITELSTENGTTFYTREFSYDENGNLVKVIHNNAVGDHAVTDYQYDINGRLTEATCDHFYGETLLDTRSVEYTYDENGNTLSVKSHQALSNDGEALESNHTYTYKYDVNNRITEEKSDVNGFVTVTKYTYDSNGNLIKLTSNEADTDLTTNVRYGYALVYMPDVMTDEEFRENILIGIYSIELPSVVKWDI